MPYDNRFSWQHLSLEIYLGCSISSEVSPQSGATYFTSFILARSLGWHAALATLEVEECGLTTRTIQQISSSLHPDCSLVKLCIGESLLTFFSIWL